MRFKILSKVRKTWISSAYEDLNNKKLFDHDDIWTLLELLNDQLKSRRVIADIKIFGGAAICLTLGEAARESTHDIDATFNHVADIEDAICDIAIEYGIDEGWLEKLGASLRAENLAHETFQHLYTFSNLVVYTASPEYILILKLLSKRVDLQKEQRDLQDIQYIWNFLGEPSIERIEELWKFYFPKRNFPKNKFQIATNVVK